METIGLRVGLRQPPRRCICAFIAYMRSRCLNVLNVRIDHETALQSFRTEIRAQTLV